MPSVGGWWGPALHALRRARQRFTEEIDAVGLSGRSVRVVAEAKWTSAPMDSDRLHGLRAYKIPALAPAGMDVDEVEIVLASRSGFAQRLIEMSDSDTSVRLVPAVDVLDGGASR